MTAPATTERRDALTEARYAGPSGRAYRIHAHPISGYVIRRIRKNGSTGAAVAVLDADLTAKAVARHPVVARDVAAILADLPGCRLVYARLTGRCCMCGHKLTDPPSIARGIGPECVKTFTGATR